MESSCFRQDFESIGRNSCAKKFGMPIESPGVFRRVFCSTPALHFLARSFVGGTRFPVRSGLAADCYPESPGRSTNRIWLSP